jgi:Flp pilus assembly protein TadB
MTFSPASQPAFTVAGLHSQSRQAATRTQQAQHAAQHTKNAEDSTHFSSNPPESQNWLKEQWEKAKETKGLKNAIAGTQEGVKRLYQGHWKRDLAASTALFFMTIPLALLIPGSHFVLVPGYIAGARAWHSARGFMHGLKHPDDVLKPKPNATPE